MMMVDDEMEFNLVKKSYILQLTIAAFAGDNEGKHQPLPGTILTLHVAWLFNSNLKRTSL
jgi:hypothetical protein